MSEAFGPYRVYEQLGIGGMAQVHRAEIASNEGFHRPIALKRMLPHVAADVEMVKAFVREARLASHLRHANVAQTYELGKVDQTYFIAMELIPGRNLREILRQCSITTGPMPVPVALNIINQICDALDYAHNLCDETGKPLGIIHRDVSPSNIILADGGVVKLIDFGVAKAQAAGMQTMSGQIKGKFGYMAPEYLAGRLDARADLFAIGVIAHELLTNRPLFSTSDEMETLHRLRTMEISPPSTRNPEVPAEVDEIVMTALERDPDQRWQHATALRTAMTTVTQRLGLAISNAKVIEWIEWLFDQAKGRRSSADRKVTSSPDADSSIMIELGSVPSVSRSMSEAKRGNPDGLPGGEANRGGGDPDGLPGGAGRSPVGSMSEAKRGNPNGLPGDDANRRGGDPDGLPGGRNANVTLLDGSAPTTGSHSLATSSPTSVVAPPVAPATLTLAGAAPPAPSFVARGSGSCNADPQVVLGSGHGSAGLRPAPPGKPSVIEPTRPVGVAQRLTYLSSTAFVVLVLVAAAVAAATVYLVVPFVT